MAGLKTYHAKRRFGVTAEPKGEVVRKPAMPCHPEARRHAACTTICGSRLDGVHEKLGGDARPESGAGDKRLAVQVEDHPLDYGDNFEGTIPKGRVWRRYGHGLGSRHTGRRSDDPHKGLKKGHLEFALDGEKLHGPLASGAHAAASRGETSENWLLIKSDDEAARGARAQGHSGRRRLCR